MSYEALAQFAVAATGPTRVNFSRGWEGTSGVVAAVEAARAEPGRVEVLGAAWTPGDFRSGEWRWYETISVVYETTTGTYRSGAGVGSYFVGETQLEAVATLAMRLGELKAQAWAPWAPWAPIKGRVAIFRDAADAVLVAA